MTKINSIAKDICKFLYEKYPYDDKIVLNSYANELIICWPNVTNEQIKEIVPQAAKINPLGEWYGGGNIHDKDLSKADTSVNIYCLLKEQENNKSYKAICSIGDVEVNVNGEMVPFSPIVKKAREYANKLGGFEKLAEWVCRKIIFQKLLNFYKK